MRQLRWGRKAGFPYTKVFVLGIILSGLGSACVIVSVVGIVNLAWGYYVSTGMWGGVTVTASGLAAMYAARAQSSFSARLYFFLSLITCLVSFAMLVLSAGGLTYKSNFYEPIRFDSYRHQVTLFLHGSVLGIGVLSLACNILSVIVCCKFIIHEKDRTEESFKLRRHRHRHSDSIATHRTSCLRSGSDAVRYSTSSRTPLFGSEGSHKLSRQASHSDSTNLKITGERSSYRRDSDRSKGSTRSHHSHYRHPSSVSQQSRQSAPMETEFTTVLLRDTDPSSLSSHIERASSHSTTDNARDSQADTLTDMSLQLVFDPDEEPLPPYEEARSFTHISGDGSESDAGTRERSNMAVSSSLPLNIPVTLIGACQTQALLRQPPPVSPSHTERIQQRRRHHGDEITSAMERTILEPISPATLSLNDGDKHCNVGQTTDLRTRPVVSADQQPVPQVENPSGTYPPEDGSASPEICALTGERMTPVAAVQPDTVTVNTSVFISCVGQHNPSPDSSDTSIPGDTVSACPNPALPHAGYGQTPTVSSSSSALPPGIHSPSSAFRPVGKQTGALAQASPSRVPGHNLFSPICSSASAHHTVYSPIASPSSANRFVCVSSPHHAANSTSSSESLSRGSPSQSLSWKKIPLPTSHNHSNRTSSVPFKEVTSKTIPGPSQPLHRGKGEQPHSLPRQSSRHVERRIATSNLKKLSSRAKVQYAPVPTENLAAKDRAQLDQSGTKPNENDKAVRSAFVSRQPCVPAKVSSKDTHFTREGSQFGASVSHSVTSGGDNSVEVNQPTSSCGLSKNLSGLQIGANSQTGVVSTHTGGTGDNYASAGIQNTLKNNEFTPVGGLPVTTGTQAAVASKQSSTFRSPIRSARNQVVGMDPTHRSAGCQATDDGGIASSMDRTHRWVMGTLPSGTRFQGTTKNTALIHSTTRNTTLSQGSLRNSGHVQGATRNSVLTQGTPRSTGTDRNAKPGQDVARIVPLTQSTSRNPAFAVQTSPGTKVTPEIPATAQISGKAHGMWVQPSKVATSAVTQSSFTATSQFAAPQASAMADPLMGAASASVAGSRTVPLPEPQPGLQPLPQPTQQCQPHRRHAQPVLVQQQRQEGEQEQEQDQQQGKPLFSVLL